MIFFFRFVRRCFPGGRFACFCRFGSFIGRRRGNFAFCRCLFLFGAAGRRSFRFCFLSRFFFAGRHFVRFVIDGSCRAVFGFPVFLLFLLLFLFRRFLNYRRVCFLFRLFLFVNAVQILVDHRGGHGRFGHLRRRRPLMNRGLQGGGNFSVDGRHRYRYRHRLHRCRLQLTECGNDCFRRLTLAFFQCRGYQGRKLLILRTGNITEQIGLHPHDFFNLEIILSAGRNGRIFFQRFQGFNNRLRGIFLTFFQCHGNDGRKLFSLRFQRLFDRFHCRLAFRGRGGVGDRRRNFFFADFLKRFNQRLGGNFLTFLDGGGDDGRKLFFLAFRGFF